MVNEKKDKEKEPSLDDILSDDDLTTEIVIDDKKPSGPTPEETIESLKSQIAERDKTLAAERARSQALETEKNKASNIATTATEDAWKAHETSIENAIIAAKSDLDSIKKQLKQARTTGDIDTEIDLEERLADVKYQYNAAEWQKKNLGEQKAERERLAKIEAANAAQPKPGTFSAKTQDWINRNQRFNTDDEFHAEAIAAHTLAVKKGYQPDSDAYFEFINIRLAKQFQEIDPTPRRSEQTTSQSTAAPPSRTSNTSSRQSINGKVRLTAEQIEAAEACGMTPAEYAADLVKIDEEKGRR